MKETFAGKIRQALKEISKIKESYTSADISIAANIITRADQKKLLSTIHDFCKSGELIRIKRGLYQYRGKKAKQPSIQERMWRILRSSRVVEPEDLQQLAGASNRYALEWLQMLNRQNIVRRLNNGKWRLIRDPVEMPKNEAKAEKLRNLRARKKEALEALNRACAAINEARTAISGMEDSV